MISKHSSIDGLQMNLDRNSVCLLHILLIICFSPQHFINFHNKSLSHWNMWGIGIFVWFYFGVMERMRYLKIKAIEKRRKKNENNYRDIQPFGMSPFVISFWHFNLFAISKLWVYLAFFDPAIPMCITYQMYKQQTFFIKYHWNMELVSS